MSHSIRCLRQCFSTLWSLLFCFYVVDEIQHELLLTHNLLVQNKTERTIIISHNFNQCHCVFGDKGSKVSCGVLSEMSYWGFSYCCVSSSHSAFWEKKRLCYINPIDWGLSEKPGCWEGDFIWYPVSFEAVCLMRTALSLVCMDTSTARKRSVELSFVVRAVFLFVPCFGRLDDDIYHTHCIFSHLNSC